VPTGISVRTPVETWAQVIHEPPTKLVSKGDQTKVLINLLAGMLFVDLAGKVLSLLDVRGFGLQPDHLGIWSEGIRTFDGSLEATFEMVVTFASTRHLFVVGQAVSRTSRRRGSAHSPNPRKCRFLLLLWPPAGLRGSTCPWRVPCTFEAPLPCR
jgi:hypothetical protein